VKPGCQSPGPVLSYRCLIGHLSWRSDRYNSVAPLVVVQASCCAPWPWPEFILCNHSSVSPSSHAPKPGSRRFEVQLQLNGQGRATAVSQIPRISRGFRRNSDNISGLFDSLLVNPKDWTLTFFASHPRLWQPANSREIKRSGINSVFLCGIGL